MIHSEFLTVERTVALVGTSLASIILGRKLRHLGFSVTFFEHGEFGGSWQLKPLGQSLASTFKNVGYLPPGCSTTLAQVQRFLVGEGVRVETGFFSHRGVARRVLFGGFLSTDLIQETMIESHVRRETVSRIEIFRDHVWVNGARFSLCFVTRNSNVPEWSFEASGRFEPEIEENVSEHVRAVLASSGRGDRQRRKPVFREEFDGFFDRYGFSSSNPDLFIGRVDRSKKGNSSDCAAIESATLRKVSSQILSLDSTRFRNQRISATCWRELQKRTLSGPLRAIDLSDLSRAVATINSELGRLVV